ncbi:iron uptake system protein EfeO [Angustibacter aerolatus]
MHRPRLAVLTALALSPLVLSACGSDDASSAGAASGATVVKISVTDDGCVPSPATAAAGPLEFQVVNTGANRVTEAEVLQDGKILGEKENLTPGLSGSFTLRLTAGDYVVACPNAATDQSAFQVTGAAASTTANADLSKSVETYQAYLENQAKGLTASTTKFVAAVQAGDVQRAKALFAPTRAYYERIEPVAESFGDLDPQIDARENDVADTDTWTGFHRIEKALWQAGSTKGLDDVADQLLADVKDLQTKVGEVQLAPEQIANGAVGLLDEVAKSKITGEEDRYSHTDLWDFAANVAGAREAVDVLAPTLRQNDPALLKTLDGQFTDVLKSLSQYQTGEGYEDYSAVTADQRRQMTQEVNALAESLSKVAGVLVKAAS